ncbi:MFS transporter [Thermonema rossianum]|uniref:MFS transporter n=1 Tax=Thermonema rossianum TaxID=55505 RepID=UPI00068A1279|nr:MFS transporter [Thermonema rossianum]
MNKFDGKQQKRAQQAWVLYDWANSVFSLVITSTIFPIYYEAIVQDRLLHVAGVQVSGSALFSYTISAAFLLVAVLSPFLTAIADYSGWRKQFMQLFCYLGSLACMGLYFFEDIDSLPWGLGAFLLGLVGFSGSIVFYNSYLPRIAPEEDYDRLSARGFAWGYVGSVLLLVICLLPILQPQWFGNIDSGTASRLAFVLTGLWWMGFAQITFRGLPNDHSRHDDTKHWILNGLRELRKVIHEIKYQKLLKRFVLAFFFFTMGLQTVMYVATLFGTNELKLSADKLIITILILQLIAVPGAHLFSYISSLWGNVRALQIALIVWVGVCVAAYYTYTEWQFYGLAAVVGLLMGGTQALARATYAKLMPDDTDDTASYFSFYDISEKLAIVLGTFTYGFIDDLTGTMRNSVLALMCFFLIGFLLLWLVPSRKVYRFSLKEIAAKASS